MQFAVDLPHFGPFSNPRLVAELAHEAEEAGWNGFFIWDHLNYNQEGLASPVEIADPWLLLAAIALHTKSIKLGPMVTPLPRRRPWKLARETVTLDHLSGGRLILGLGLGTNFYGEYHDFGESTDIRTHGERLDEGLAILTRLWSGEQFSYEGQHYQISQVQFLPKPLQPHIPIWLAGNWPHKKPFRRAAQYNGIFPQRIDRALTPEDMRELVGYIQQQRTQTAPFDVVAFGLTSGTDKGRAAAHVASFAQAGATWWLESFDPLQTLEQVRQRIQQGPPEVR
ncbi:LLM class flavin-dependent oxidoreductase [Ktedonosporobacter rubrisoli]|uniref:LLM class flavin-dependent oxidoreductase n=1 Tax=Ktedonosporobacter rubrisoli TaxID=2509675 RepID=A0A4P6JII8_KTERU|nr:LLM class flavin-dependent oxidoreductase [Ktedonosporobacter rubrisoli]QBD74878.1 LLM class flavin-dependent oxidoreductase [Ktedonosporobacter rubrisoli]